MAIFSDLNSFEEFAKKQIQDAMWRKILPELKEKAQDIVLEKIYSVFTPKVYKRAYELTNAFKIETKWEGNTCWGILKVKSDMHGDNPTWNGENHSLDEIINDYFARGGWGNGSPREGVNTLEEVDNEMIQTGMALQLLLDELKKHFDII